MLDHRPDEEICRLGDEIYERDIRPLVEAEHRGDFLAIDVETGLWDLGKTLTEARDQLGRRRPEAFDVFLMRVGHQVLSHHGGRPLRTPQ